MSGEGARASLASARSFVLGQPGSLIAAAVLAVIALAAFAAPLIAPQNPFDLASFDVLDADLPPFFVDGSDPRFLLGTNSQGRDLLSAILYGTRISLTVGVLAVAIQAAIGIPLGLIGGYVGGRVDGLIARVADVQLSLSTLILAIIALALVRAGLGGETLGRLAVPLLVLVIGLAEWPYFARTARAATLVEAAKDHVRAAKALGAGDAAIVRRHILPNILSPLDRRGHHPGRRRHHGRSRSVLPWPRFADHPALPRHPDPLRLRPDLCRHLVGHRAARPDPGQRAGGGQCSGG